MTSSSHAPVKASIPLDPPWPAASSHPLLHCHLCQDPFTSSSSPSSSPFAESIGSAAHTASSLLLSLSHDIFSRSSPRSSTPRGCAAPFSSNALAFFSGSPTDTALLHFLCSHKVPSPSSPPLLLSIRYRHHLSEHLLPAPPTPSLFPLPEASRGKGVPPPVIGSTPPLVVLFISTAAASAALSSASCSRLCPHFRLHRSPLLPCLSFG